MCVRLRIHKTLTIRNLIYLIQAKPINLTCVHLLIYAEFRCLTPRFDCSIEYYDLLLPFFSRSFIRLPLYQKITLIALRIDFAWKPIFYWIWARCVCAIFPQSASKTRKIINAYINLFFGSVNWIKLSFINGFRFLFVGWKLLVFPFSIGVLYLAASIGSTMYWFVAKLASEVNF